MIRHRDSGNLGRKLLLWAYGSRGLENSVVATAWWQVRQQEQQGAHTLNQTQSNDSRVFKLSKPATGDILHPAKPLPLNLLPQYHQLRAKCSTTEAYGGHSYSSYSSSKTRKIKEADRITGEVVRLGTREEKGQSSRVWLV